MKLSNSVAHALAAVVQVAANKSSKPLANPAICKIAKLPERYILQLMRRLVKGGVLESVRGVAGGYRLARAADQLTLADIIAALDPIETEVGLLCESLEPASQQVVRQAFEGLEGDAKRRLAQIRISDLRPAGV
ncbi:RrF2 family transcriptional regulator [Lacipirellula parvula]|nr:Rrf2 family transcriptional regulator [Lacipirellula parvula]